MTLGSARFRALFSALLGALACTNAYAEPAPNRIVAIGDLHGDYDAYLDIVQAAGVADKDGRWRGGSATLVQLGDVPDRGPDSLKIIHHMEKLEKEAARAGGQVIAIIGNHEAMNMTGDLRYVHPGEYEALRDGNSRARRERVWQRNKEALLAFYRTTDPQVTEEAAKLRWFGDYPLGRIEHQLAWSPKGEIGAWVLGHPAIVEIGDTLFVHGGISVETSTRPIDTVNAEVRAELAKGKSKEPSILTDSLGPLWYRGNVVREPPAPPVDGAPPAVERPSMTDELTQVLAAYGATRLVVAHTPDLSGILASEGGRLIRIDTGNSAYYGGPHSYLEIKDGQASACQRKAEETWSCTVLPSPHAGDR